METPISSFTQGCINGNLIHCLHPCKSSSAAVINTYIQSYRILCLPSMLNKGSKYRSHKEHGCITPSPGANSHMLALFSPDALLQYLAVYILVLLPLRAACLSWVAGSRFRVVYTGL